MKRTPAWLILCVIALVAGLALGMTNALTEDEIANQAIEAAAKARRTVMADAEDFVELPTNDGAPVDNCYEATAGGNVIGHVVQVTVQGYGGPIEVVVGIANDETITGISCGGSGFSETAGLGAKVKDALFSGQFAGMTTPLALTKNGGEVDSVTAASISSGAVCDAINAAGEYVMSLGS